MMDNERENDYVEDEDIDKYGNLNQEKLKDVANRALLRGASLCTSILGGLAILQKPELSTKDKIIGCIFAFIATIVLGSYVNDAIKKKAQKKSIKKSKRMPTKMTKKKCDKNKQTIQEW